MSEHQHYVPVLRIKPAELRALRALNPVLRSITTPILECPPRVLRSCDTTARLEKRLDHIVSHISGWSGRSVFIDFSMVGSARPDALEMMVAKTALAGIRPILVVSLKGAADSVYMRAIQAALSRHGAGVCLRISPEELRLTGVADKINERLRLCSASPTVTDLVIDREYVDSGTRTYEEFAREIPSVDSWRTLTVLGGSFPEDLSGLEARSTHRLRRFEWKQWKALASWSGRRPAFGDYTIQHVLFREPVAVPNFSASVRYTIEEEFYVMRGEGVLNENGPGYDQWNGWAEWLVERPEFFGGTFSDGDHYIVDHATGARSTGSAQTWLQAGFSHHLTATALQVAGLLAQVRQITASTAAVNWASVVDINQPGAIL